MPEIPQKSGLVAVTSWRGTAPPPQVEQSMHDQGMGYTLPFGPGRPLNPFDGGGDPWRWNRPTGYNITSRPLRDGRIAFATLKGIIDSWDVARICISHRIDDVRSLDWSIEAMAGVDEDISTALDFARAKLRYPEGPGSRKPFRAWLASYLEDVLRYDAGSIFRRRDRAGRVIGLQVISGVTIAPLLDWHGATPLPPAPAYMQYVNGMPWQELTTDDLIYVPFRPQPDSPYGFAPLESVLLTANTDLRMQQFFLQHFTAGTIPEGFATAPEDTSAPGQIEEWQQLWDAVLYGDMEAKHQLKWVPFGTKFEWAKDTKFDKDFQNYLITKVAAAFHVTPADLGFTYDVNRATSETQTEIQFRVGTLPLVQHIEDVLTAYLQEDLGLPVVFRFDTGQEKDDRLQEAQAQKLYVDMGALSPDEVREGILGRPVDMARPTPRFVNHSRRGPIPILDIVSASGKVDAETYGPAKDQPLLPDPEDAVGVLPEEGTAGYKSSLATTDARQEAARQELHPEAQPRPTVAESKATPAPPAPGAPAAKDMTAGITSATGITGNPLHSAEDEDDLATLVRKALGFSLDDPSDRATARKVMEVFGIPRMLCPACDGVGYLADSSGCGECDESGYIDMEDVRKTASVAGLAVKAADTGRVLLLQRALNQGPTTDAEAFKATGGQHDDVTEVREDLGLPPLDKAAGRWEFPGGHLEDGETALQGAAREWAEEVGCPVPPGVQSGGWEAPGGVYVGIVWVIPNESDVQINLDPDDRAVINPDDPDGDMTESVAWFDPAHLPGMPSLRQELSDSVKDWLPAVLGAQMPEDVRKDLRRWRDNARGRVKVGKPPRRFDDSALPAELVTSVWRDLAGATDRAQVDRAFGRVVKAAPKAPSWRDGAPDVPQRSFDLAIVDHYAPLIQRALGRLFPRGAVRGAAEAGTTTLLPQPDSGPLAAVLNHLWADAWATGRHGAKLQVDKVRKDDEAGFDISLDWSTWEPGNLDAALLAADGGFQLALMEADITIKGLSDTTLERMGTLISEGLLNGDSVDTVAQSLVSLLGGDLSRAEMIAQTETARLQTLATFDTYADMGVTAWDWLTTSGACPRCVDLESRNPHLMGESGPPAHPRCRCAAAPVWQSI